MEHPIHLFSSYHSYKNDDNPTIQPTHLNTNPFHISTSIKLLTHYQRLKDIMNSKKLGEMIKKWQRLAAMGRRRSKGHFVVYTKEGKRFVVPLCYLNHPIFRVLLEMAEEEFGSMVHGPLKVPCEEDLMDYIVSLLKRNPPGEVEKALVSITTCRGTSLTSFSPLCHAYNQGKATMVL